MTRVSPILNWSPGWSVEVVSFTIPELSLTVGSSHETDRPTDGLVRI